MEQIKELICIRCPLGCALRVTLADGVVTKVQGHSCKRGEEYAQKECTHPTRMVTSTVRVENGWPCMLPVKTREDVPKEKIYACIEALRGVRVQAPVKIGDVIVHNAAGTGIDIVATRHIACYTDCTEACSAAVRA